jgi:hypothetical protein
MLRRFLAFMPLIFFTACGSMDGYVNLPAAIQTLTATVWTPLPTTPTSTPVPATGKIVDALNNALIGVDPLAESIGSRFTVIDAKVITEPPAGLSGILRIDIECEWIYSDSCTPEESFARVMRALRTNEKVRERIYETVPATIHTLQVASYNHMNPDGMIVVMWPDVLAYMDETINGNQLGARIVRLPIP